MAVTIAEDEEGRVRRLACKWRQCSLGSCLLQVSQFTSTHAIFLHQHTRHTLCMRIPTALYGSAIRVRKKSSSYDPFYQVQPKPPEKTGVHTSGSPPQTADCHVSNQPHASILDGAFQSSCTWCTEQLIWSVKLKKR